MKRVLTICASALLAAAAFTSALAQTVESRYIIMFNRSELPSDVEWQVSSAGGTLVRSLPKVGIAVAVSSDPDFMSNASGIRGVFGVAPDLPQALPETVIRTEGLTAPTAADDLFNFGLVWGVERVGAPEAWANGNTGSHDTVVAVIDTGIATNHPDLAPNIVYTDCYTSAGSAQSGDCNPYPSLSFHGTHVAGTVAAVFDGGRVVGVGPNLGLAGYNVFELIPGCGVCAFTSSRWTAMLDAAERGFDVISMSLGGFGVFGGQGTEGLATFYAAEKRVANQVLAAQTAIVASSGNAAADLNGPLVHLPGDVPGLVNVGATGIRPIPRYAPGFSDVRSFYSNYGAPVNVSAPGGDCGLDDSCSSSSRPANWFEFLVLSTFVVPSPGCAVTQSCPVGYAWSSGTSMATPHVSATIGLVKDANPALSPLQLQSIVQSTADSLGDRQQFGHGIINVPAAIEAAR